MGKNSCEQLTRDVFASTGVEINGSRPYDIRVNNEKFYQRLIAGGSMALGESYMDGWWDCEALDQFFDRILTSRLDQRKNKPLKEIWQGLLAKLMSSPGKLRAFEIGRRHYDIGNDLFGTMLDKSMNYSCAYWKEAGDLGEAQEAKMELICRKLKLDSGMRVLDIGCGWGGLAEYMARHYGVSVLGVTVSKEQAKLAAERCKDLPVTISLIDYRDISGRFDRIVSVGMFEHVGYRNYREYMQVAQRSLAPEGLFLLHTIGGNESKKCCDPWITRYIFPNSMIPSGRQIAAAAEGLLVLEDWHSFGQDYDLTLMAWHRNFIRNWDRIKSAYDKQFYRMWIYYLLACAGSFRARRNQLWQIVFSGKGLREKYESVR